MLKFIILMKINLLLINPWIYDFAAYNLWSVPLGLYRCAEYLSLFDVSIKYIDCLEAYIPKRFGAGKYNYEVVEKPDCLSPLNRHYKRYGIGIDEFHKSLTNAGFIDAVLITSSMAYWYPGVQQSIELIRESKGDVPVILGGLYPKLYTEHASSFSGADALCLGRAEDALQVIIKTFGFKLKQIRQTPIPYYDMGLHKHSYAALLTSTGCPFRCSYCASSIINGGYQRRNFIEVIEEIKGLSKRGISDIAFYDDALLYDAESHIKPILREVIRRKLPLRFHTPNGLHARFIDEEVSMLMKRSGFKTIRIGFETLDSERQSMTGGKTTVEDLHRALHSLRSAGFADEDIGVYLMYGLPGQDLEEVREGVEYLKRQRVIIKLTEFSPIRGTKAWQELINCGIISDNLDPIMTNNTVFTELLSGIDSECLSKLRLEVKEYNDAFCLASL